MPPPRAALRRAWRRAAPSLAAPRPRAAPAPRVAGEAPGPCWRGFCSGGRSLAAVVRDLRKQGRLSDVLQRTSEQPSGTETGPGFGFVDIDAELAREAELEGLEETASEHEGASFGSHGFVHGDAEGGQVGAEDLEAARRHRSGAAALEDVSLLSEEELRERVRRSIEELVPSDTAEAAGGGAAQVGTEGLTPAQVFYLENRERLVSRAQEYYLEKQKELQQQQEEPLDVEDEWRFYHEPVVRPPKGHLWSIGGDGAPEQHGLEEGWREAVAEWPRGRLPTADMLAELLRAEQARDIDVVDLATYGRQDVGTHGIICTGVTTRHCRRLGDIVSRATQSVQAPHISAFCFGTRNDEWVVAHCGPIKVHIFLAETRQEYNLQLLWRRPEEFFMPGDFPHYYEVYTTAAEAFQLPGGHVTRPSGSRSQSPIPAPFSDMLHSQLMQPDYDAAEDARYATPTLVREVGGSDRGAGWQDEQSSQGQWPEDSWPGGGRSGPGTEGEGLAGQGGRAAAAGQTWPSGWDSDHEADTDGEEEGEAERVWDLGGGPNDQDLDGPSRAGAASAGGAAQESDPPDSEEQQSDERRPLRRL